MRQAENAAKQLTASGPLGKRLIFPSAMCALASMLAACGPTYLNPPVPNNVPLAPAVIYVPACAPEKSGGFFSTLPSAEDAEAGLAACIEFRPLLQDRVSKMLGRYAMLEAERTGPSYLDIRPNLNVEETLEAKYRVVMDNLHTFWIDIGTPPFAPYRVRRFLTHIGIYDIERKKLLGTATLKFGLDIAESLPSRLFSGLEGARCDPINRSSLGAFLGG